MDTETLVNGVRRQEPSEVDLQATQSLKIKISSRKHDQSDKSLPISPCISISPHIKPSPESSLPNSPSLVSPPSSAFVSALQSPYISPRSLVPLTESITLTSLTSPFSNYDSQSDDIPSSSYTPEKSDFSDDSADKKQNLTSNNSILDFTPRISFSFPVPRISFSKGSICPSSDAKVRSCDVYIGYHGQNGNLIRFCKWLKSELESHGIACFVAEREKYTETQSREIADQIMSSSTFGIVLVTVSSLLNHYSIKEIKIFSQKKNLIPIWFDTDQTEISALFDRESGGKELREAIDGLMKFQEFKLEANDSNWRNCLMRTVGILKSKLGRKSIGEKEADDIEEIPFARNQCFIGREKELMEIETSLFGCSDCIEIDFSRSNVNEDSNRFSDEFANEEGHEVEYRGRNMSFDLKNSEEPSEPIIQLTNKERIIQQLKSKNRKQQSTNSRYHGSNPGVFCLNGISGIGKTELAMEFAYRYSQRYKMVLWVNGQTEYLQQSMLNLSLNLGLDVSAEPEKEKRRIEYFEDQEFEAFQRVRRELFRDVPYLLIIDNLESERDWWEGKDLQDLIPRNTGASHVIITTRLSKVANFHSMQLTPLAWPDAILLLKGKKKKEYPGGELNVLRKFDEKLGRLSFGLCIIGCLLSELSMSPSSLFDMINRASIDDRVFFTDSEEDLFCKSNMFLMKILNFCFSILDQTKSRKKLALKMALAGAWFPLSPIPVTLLSSAACKIPNSTNGLYHMNSCFNISKTPKLRKIESESALLLVKLGLAKMITQKKGCCLQFHEITQIFSRRKGGLVSAKAMILIVRKMGNPIIHTDHLWASVFLVLGCKSNTPLVQLRPVDLILFIKKTALPLAIQSFITFSRCNAALELLKVCTDVLEEVEKSFVSQIQDWFHGSFCWKNKLNCNQNIDEHIWQDITLLKATLLETRAKLMLRGGHFDNGEELCRTCISIRTVMLGHNHPSTLAAQETLAKLVRLRSKI